MSEKNELLMFINYKLCRLIAQNDDDDHDDVQVLVAQAHLETSTGDPLAVTVVRSARRKHIASNQAMLSADSSNTRVSFLPSKTQGPGA